MPVYTISKSISIRKLLLYINPSIWGIAVVMGGQIISRIRIAASITRNGVKAFTTLSKGRFPTLTAENRTSPTGGVSTPMVRFVMVRTAK